MFIGGSLEFVKKKTHRTGGAEFRDRSANPQGGDDNQYGTDRAQNTGKMIIKNGTIAIICGYKRRVERSRLR